MTSFVRGLKSTITQDLLKQRPSNLDQCEEFAQIIEAADVNDPLSMLNTRTPMTQYRQGYANSKPFCQRCNTRHTFGQHTRRLPPRQPPRDSSGQNLNTHPQGLNPASPTHIPYHTSQPSFNRPPFHPTHHPKFTGKVPSHPRLNPTKGSVGLVTCFQCGLSGHTKQSCDRLRVHLSSSSMLRTDLVASSGSLPSIALLDSGSQANLISERKLNQLSRLCGYEIRRRRASFEAVAGLGGRTVSVQSSCVVLIRLGGIDRPVLFSVVPEIHSRDFIILGRDFLGQTDAVIDVPRNVLLLNWNAPVQRRSASYTVAETGTYQSRIDPHLHGDNNIKKLMRDDHVEFVRAWYQRNPQSALLCKGKQ